MKLGLSTFVYFNYSLTEAIRRIGSIGYKGVTIWGGRPHAYPGDLDHKEIEEVKNLIENVNVQVAGFIPAQFRYPTNLCIDNERIRQESIKYIREGIKVGSSMGAREISICPGHSVYPQRIKTAKEIFCENLVILSEYAKEKQVVLLVESGTRYESDIATTVEETVEIIEKIGKDNVGILVDVGHHYVNKESLSDIGEKIKGLPIGVHIDDNDGNTDQHLIPGLGKINYTKFLEGLKRIGFDGFLTVELSFSYVLDPDRAAYESKINMERIMEQIS